LTSTTIIAGRGRQAVGSSPGADALAVGGHRLLCDSALDAGAYLTLLEGAKATLAITDPPYSVAIDGHVGGAAGRNGKSI